MPESTAASLPPELDVLDEDVLEVDEDVVPDEEVELLELPPSTSFVVPLSPHATATIPTINPEAIPILGMIPLLFVAPPSTGSTTSST